ncbi:MAG: hypothetical protein ACMG5Z_07660 [Luteimonas sp.]
MKIGPRLACICLLAITAQAMADESGAGWIGKIVPPYPDGVTETSGTCIGEAQFNPETVCDHAFAVLDDPQSKLRTILALEQAPHFGKLPLWRIVDALEPDELADRSVQVATGTCQQRGSDDATVVALVRVAGQEWLAPVLRAWRFDVAAGGLLPVAVADIRCRNEGFGYDG